MIGARCPLMVAVMGIGAGLPAQQRTLVVDRLSGPFTQIADAVAAARPGDRIEVHPGSYSRFTVSIGVDIDAALGGQGRSTSSFSVTNLPANQAVRIQGILYAEYSDVTNCAGPVHLEQVGYLYNSFVAFALTISASPQVLLSRCAVGDSRPVYPFAAPPSLIVNQSSVLITGCTMLGAHGYGTAGLDAIACNGATIALSDSVVLGGDGYADSICFGQNTFPHPGGGGITGTGQVTAVGASSIHGGVGGTNNCGTASSGAAFSGVTLRLSPGVTVGAGGPSPPQPIAEPPHLTIPAMLILGFTCVIRVDGCSNATVLLALDLWNGDTVLPGVDLPFMLTRAAYLQGVGVPDPAGVVTFSQPLPQVPWLLNQFVLVQAAAVDGQGVIRLSTSGGARLR